MKIKQNEVIAKLDTIAPNVDKDEITIFFTIDAKNPELLKTFVQFHKNGRIMTDMRGKKYQEQIRKDMKDAVAV